MRDAEEETERQERQLARLLRTGTPRLATGPDWIPQIRRRVVRRRRRRRAALLTAVTAVAGVVLATGLTGTSPTRPAPLAEPAQVSTAQRTTGPVTNYLDLTLNTPGGWHTLNTADATSYVTVFVANRPLGPAGRCTEPTKGGFTCSPVSRLADDEVLIAFRQEDDPPEARWSPHSMFRVQPLDGPDVGCRSLGGDQELKGWGRPAHPETNLLAINAYVCLRNASDTTRHEAENLLGSAVLEQRTEAPKPGHRTTP